MVRFLLPWGILILYYEVPNGLVPFLRSGEGAADRREQQQHQSTLTAAELTLARWLGGDAPYRNDRLKLIADVHEGPWIVRNMVGGRPALIGRKVPVTYRYVPPSSSAEEADFLQVDLDVVGSAGRAAKKIVGVCRRYMSLMTVDIGFVIEGRVAGELPEEMMGAVRIHECDPARAPTV
jgi:Protein ENHANCED DISEASE RESISTANCE 2, C-terminal